MDSGMPMPLTAADVGAITRNNDGWGDGGCWWILILFFAMFGWGGNGFGWGNRGAEQPVTESGLCNAMNFNDLENQVGRIADNQAAIARQTDNAICNLGYSALQQTNETQRQLADCCCTTNRNIDQSRYEAAMNTAAINANTTEQVQKVLDQLCQNRMADMQSQINQLQLQAATCGMMKFPQSWSYNAGNFPVYNSCGCGCGTGYGSI